MTIGFIIGGVAFAVFFAKSAKNAGEISGLNHRADWEKRVFQAYSEEIPEVATWALENLADILKKQAEFSGQDERELIRKDLILTYARLAITFRKVKDVQRYQESISSAVSLARKVYPDAQYTERDLLNFVEKADQASRDGLRR